MWWLRQQELGLFIFSPIDVTGRNHNRWLIRLLTGVLQSRKLRVAAFAAANLNSRPVIDANDSSETTQHSTSGLGSLFCQVSGECDVHDHTGHQHQFGPYRCETS